MFEAGGGGGVGSAAGVNAQLVQSWLLSTSPAPQQQHIVDPPALCCGLCRLTSGLVRCRPWYFLP